MTILLWMAYAALCAAAFAGFGARIELLAAQYGHPRRAMWAGLMVLSVLLPIALGARTAPVLSTASSAVAARAVAPEPTPRRVSTDMIVLICWSSASTLFGALLVGAHWRTARALGRYRAAVVAGQNALLSDDFGPALVGLVHPRIVVPAWALQLDVGQQELVVTHEAEHRSARDPALLFAALAALALMPWNVGLWLQFFRLRTAIELDCDARVVRRHHYDPIVYGTLLVNVRELVQARPRPMLAFFRSDSALTRRVRALVRPPMRAQRRWLPTFALALSLVAAVAFIPAPSVRTVAAELAAERTVTAPAPAVALRQVQTGVRSTADARGQYEFSDNVVSEHVPEHTAAASRRSGGATARRAAPSLSTADLPPVHVTDPAAADIGHPVSAVLPPVRPLMRGVIRAVPTAGRGGFAMGTASPGAPSTMIRATVPVVRPDTLRPH